MTVQQTEENGKGESAPLLYPTKEPTHAEAPPLDESDALLGDDKKQNVEDLIEHDGEFYIDITRNWTFVDKFCYFAHYPVGVWFILCTEAMERFSFYGMRVILPLYLTNTPEFGLDENQAISIISIFNAGCYFTPILSSMLADQFLGKYWTILLLCLVYCMGGAITSITAFPGLLDKVGLAGILIGLTLIAIGTGGIKSSVSSFAAETFSPKKGDRYTKLALLTSFFTIFYLSVNIGSTMSTIATPIIRSAFSYAIAFAIPAILLFFATVVFAFGKPLYNHVPTGGFILFKAAKCFVVGLFNIRNPKFKHLGYFNILGRAEHVYGKEFVADLRDALRIVLHLPPIMFFFALSDLSASVWIYQANLMDRTIFTKEIGSDQLSFINPVFVIVLAPILDRIVLPVINKLFFRTTLLRRMYAGFIFTSLAMALSGVLQIIVESHPHQVHFAFQIPQYFFMCLGELSIAIPAMDFAFTEAPVTMKSMMQACFLFYISCGDLFDLVVINIMAPINIFQNDHKFGAAYRNFVFAVIMLLGLVYFFLTTFRYKYKGEREKKEKSSNGNNIQDSAESVPPFYPEYPAEEYTEE